MKKEQERPGAPEQVMVRRTNLQVGLPETQAPLVASSLPWADLLWESGSHCGPETGTNTPATLGKLPPDGARDFLVNPPRAS